MTRLQGALETVPARSMMNDLSESGVVVLKFQESPDVFR